MRSIRLGVFELTLMIISTFIAYNAALFHPDLNDLSRRAAINTDRHDIPY